MGRDRVGEIASELAVAIVHNACSPAPVGDGASESVYPTLAGLVSAIVDTNSTIFRFSINDPSYQGMGTTIALLSMLGSESDPTSPSAIVVRHPHTDPRQEGALMRTWQNRVTAESRSLPVPIRVVNLGLHGARAIKMGLPVGSLLKVKLQNPRPSDAKPMAWRADRQITRIGCPPIF
jgi:hypothetical protein